MKSAAVPTVFIVDDDRSMRQAIQDLVESVGLRAEAFATGQEFLNRQRTGDPSCLVLDVRLPQMSGLDFQRQLAEADIQIPIIFITAHGDIPMSVKAMKAGAVDFLTKPFRDQDMLDAVTRALDRDRKRRVGEKARSDLRQRFATLTQREQEVMTLAASGLRNKQIAYQLQVEEITVKIHRGRAMKKMEARSIADLVGMAETLGIRRTD